MRDLPPPPPTSRFGAGFTRSPHSPLNRLSYLLNPPSEPTSDLYAANPSSQRPNDSMDTDMNNGYLDGVISSQTRLPQLPLYSRAFEPFMRNEEHNKEVAFTPSYLHGSDYIRKLDEARKAKQARKEAQQQAGNGLSAGITTTGALASKPPASHLGMTYDLIERAPTVDDETIVPPLPTKWNKDDKQGPLEVLADGLEVKYASGRTAREQEHEACAIRADHPMPWQAGLYYFENHSMYWLLGKERPSGRPPGWEPDSWGYHGDDGDIYSGDKIGKPYEGKNFGPPDIIGCGVNFRTREAFLQKMEGSLVCIRRAILEGDIDKAVKYTYTYYPDVLRENYDVYFKLRCRTFIEMVRKSAEISNSNTKKSNGHPYDDTLNKMDVDENGFPDQMEEDVLDTQTNQEDWLVKAVQYGQSLQEDFRDDTRPETTKTLNEVFSLLAYPNPLEVKEVAPLLDRKGRVAVAEELNSAILSSLGKSSRSALENLYGQTSVLLDYLREDGGPGSFITIQSVVDAIPRPF
ncbi:hypothetical protein GL218_05464 [Daldinia childiae]|uniref:uncharacterized protein n=1 Tax=Daldinia childiae TaxID=326645 RepID=UPI00144587DA|nr:uncharacterized protein GL218_05464 [Daldinia childiae]KAF3058523.1 hypothetical protein GL218_05464 [Daldinia childiae]